MVWVALGDSRYEDSWDVCAKKRVFACGIWLYHAETPISTTLDDTLVAVGCCGLPWTPFNISCARRGMLNGAQYTALHAPLVQAGRETKVPHEVDI